jgi:tetratricopeptide (TPR) repeat protein
VSEGAEPAGPATGRDRPAPAEWWPALALVLLALFLRTRALDWGLPAFTEEATPFRKAAEFWGAHTGRWTLDPKFYNYPTLTFYLQFAWLGIAGLVGSVLGAWQGLAGFRGALALPEPGLVVASRALDAILGAVTVLPVWRLARSLAWPAGGTAARWAGLAAGALIAVSPVHAAESRAIGTDVPMALAVALSLLYMERAVRTGSGRDATIAAVAAGCAASCKYPAGLLVLPLALSAGRPGAALRLVLVAAASFAVTSPAIVMNLPDAWRALTYERFHMATGHFRAVNEAGWLHYARDLAPRALGWAGWLAALGGLVAAVRAGGGGRLVALFALAGLLVLGSWRVAFDRYVLLVLPPLAALAGGFLALAISRMPASRPAKLTASLVVLALAVAPPLAASWGEAVARARPSTREAAAAWVRASIPKGSLVAAERYSVETMADSLALLVIPFDSVEPHRYDSAYSLPYYAPFEWIVLSSALGDRYLSRIDEFPAQATFYEGVARHLALAAEFRPERGRTGPTIRIFRREPGTTLPDFRGIDPKFYDTLPDPAAMADFLRTLAGALARGGRADLALAAAEQAVALAPRDVKALTNLAVLRGERGEYLAALNTYQRALALAPDEPRLYYNLGRLYESRELWHEAAASYARAADLAPAMVEAWWGLYAAQIHLDDRPGAAGSLKRILDRLPAGPRADEVRALLRTLEAS